MFGVEKLDILSCVSVVLTCDRQTDGHLVQHSPRYA